HVAFGPAARGVAATGHGPLPGDAGLQSVPARGGGGQRRQPLGGSCQRERAALVARLDGSAGTAGRQRPAVGPRPLLPSRLTAWSPSGARSRLICARRARAIWSARPGRREEFGADEAFETVAGRDRKSPVH